MFLQSEVSTRKRANMHLLAMFTSKFFLLRMERYHIQATCPLCPRYYRAGQRVFVRPGWLGDKVSTLAFSFSPDCVPISPEAFLFGKHTSSSALHGAVGFIRIVLAGGQRSCVFFSPLHGKPPDCVHMHPFGPHLSNANHKLGLCPVPSTQSPPSRTEWE